MSREHRRKHRIESADLRLEEIDRAIAALKDARQRLLQQDRAVTGHRRPSPERHYAEGSHRMRHRQRERAGGHERCGANAHYRRRHRRIRARERYLAEKDYR